jgi:diacylglycerol kinase family enzyme
MTGKNACPTGTSHRRRRHFTVLLPPYFPYLSRTVKLLVLLNQAAGTLANSSSCDEPERIRAGFAAAGADVEVRSVEGKDLQAAVAAAIRDRYDAVIGGGGDGTLNTIAAALAGSETAFGVLPLGTHNHFAKDLGIPLDLDQAVAALAGGTTKRIDVGEVNGRPFLNFSAIGLHPLMVKHRDAQRDALGRGKFVAMFVAMFRVLRVMPIMRVTLAFGDTVLRRLTPSVIVCNNPHQMSVFGVDNVSYTDRGALNVYLARSTSPLGVIWLFLRAAFRRLDNAQNFESMVLPEVTIDTANRHARISIDGEVADLRTPLKYRIRKGGLKVIVPGGRE